MDNNIINTHSYNIVTDKNNHYIFDNNNKEQVLMQRIADNKFIYVAFDKVNSVFGDLLHRDGDVTHYKEASVSDDSDRFYSLEAPDKLEPYNDNLPCIEVKKRMWNYNETLALIQCVEAFKDNLYHPRKRKHVWQTISESLLSEHIEYSPEVCKKKWSNLVKTYKNVKDNIGRTGRPPIRFMFLRKSMKFLEPIQILVLHSIDVLQIEDSHTEADLNNTQIQEQNLQKEANEKTTEDGIGEQRAEIHCSSNKKKKTNIMKLREEIADLKRKCDRKIELEERKLLLLEKKIKLDERKVKALEKIAQIETTEENE